MLGRLLSTTQMFIIFAILPAKLRCSAKKDDVHDFSSKKA